MPRSFAVRPALVIVLLTLCLGVVVAPAGAMIIISNYPFTIGSNGTGLFVGFANGGDDVPKSKAAGFTMPAGFLHVGFRDPETFDYFWNSHPPTRSFC